LEGANIEFGLICIALNLSKMIKQMLEMGQKQFIFLKNMVYCSVLCMRRKILSFQKSIVFDFPGSSLNLV
jgi:hypothetical protein